MMQDIGFLVFPGFDLLDLSEPAAVLQKSGDVLANERYRISVLSVTGGSVSSSAGVEISTSKISRKKFGCLYVIDRLPRWARNQVQSEIRFAIRNSKRVIGVRGGVFHLGQAGLLSNRSVTTDGRSIGLLKRSFPGARVDGNRGFVRDGDVWTCAGGGSTLELTFALIEEVSGFEVSQSVARDWLLPYPSRAEPLQIERLNGESERVESVLKFANAHLQEAGLVERMAQVLEISPRQLARIMIVDMGVTPAKAVERLRIEAARNLMEADNVSLNEVAYLAGFNDPERMRRAFLRGLGRSPLEVRRSMRTRRISR